MKTFTTQEIMDLLNRVMVEEISFTRMVEIINERVSGVEVSKFKDGDFVYEDGRIIIVKSYPNNYHALTYPGYSDKVIYNNIYALDFSAPTFRHVAEEEKQIMIDAMAKDGKRWNAEKKCVEDIPVCKFQKGDKVRIKDGVSSKTHHNVSPGFMSGMDELIGKTMTVSRYTHESGYIICNEYGWNFNEDWLEPYEELKEGDLAIFWEDCYKEGVTVRIYREKAGSLHRDSIGYPWRNAIRFESEEQFKRFIEEI